MRTTHKGMLILLAVLFLLPAVAAAISPVPVDPHLEKVPHLPMEFQVPTISFHGMPLPLEVQAPPISFHGINLPLQFNVPEIAFKGNVDLVISDFKGKLLKPGQEDYSGLAVDYRRIQLHWRVKNTGSAPSDATVLRVRGVADGAVSLPDDWTPDVNMKRKDFPVPILDPAIHQAAHDVYEVFAVPDGSVKFRFNAQVNPEHTGAETNYANNGRLDTFALALANLAEGMNRTRSGYGIVVTRPRHRSLWYAGRRHIVNWHSLLAEGRVRIFLELTPENAVLPARRWELTPAAGVSSLRGSRRVTLPAGLLGGDRYRIRVQSMQDPKVFGVSEKFTVRSTINPGVVQHTLRRKLAARPPAAVRLPEKQTLAPGEKPPVVLKKLWLQSPRGMETWYIGKTYPVTWKSSGVTGRVRVVLVDRHGKKRTINGMVETDAQKGLFSWKIGPNIQPGSMYRIYVTTVDGKIKSKSSGGFNIRMQVNPSAAKKALDKKTKPPPKAPAAGVHRNLQ